MRTAIPKLALPLAAALFAAGCGNPGVKKVTVAGTVTYKGHPVPSGILRFVGPEGSYSAASIRPDGWLGRREPCAVRARCRSCSARRSDPGPHRSRFNHMLECSTPAIAGVEALRHRTWLTRTNLRPTAS